MEGATNADAAKPEEKPEPVAEQPSAAPADPVPEKPSSAPVDAAPEQSAAAPVDSGLPDHEHDKDKYLADAFTALMGSKRKFDGKGERKFNLGELVQACCDKSKDPSVFPPGMISKAQRNASGILAELCACRPLHADGRPCEDAKDLLNWMVQQPFFQRCWLNEMVHLIRTDMAKPPTSKTTAEMLFKMLWHEELPPEPEDKRKGKKGGKKGGAKKKRPVVDVSGGVDGQGSEKAAKGDAPAEDGGEDED